MTAAASTKWDRFKSQTTPHTICSLNSHVWYIFLGGMIDSSRQENVSYEAKKQPYFRHLQGLHQVGRNVAVRTRAFESVCALIQRSVTRHAVFHHSRRQILLCSKNPPFIDVCQAEFHEYQKQTWPVWPQSHLFQSCYKVQGTPRRR